MKHWKTTLIGAAIAVLNLFLGGVSDPKTLIVSGAVAVLGGFAHDPQPTE